MFLGHLEVSRIRATCDGAPVLLETKEQRVRVHRADSRLVRELSRLGSYQPRFRCGGNLPWVPSEPSPRSPTLPICYPARTFELAFTNINRSIKYYSMSLQWNIYWHRLFKQHVDIASNAPGVQV